jgi:glucose/mannose transport system permease protein
MRPSQRGIAALSLLPAFVAVAICFYGFIAWTLVISLTSSRMLPRYDFVGLRNYLALLEDERFHVAFTNLFVFGFWFIGGTLVAGFLLAVLVDLSGRAGAVFRTIYLYPLAISWLVTGLLWQWILNPTFGLERAVRGLGFDSFVFDWITRQDRALYTLVIAAVWHIAGLVMAIFLAGLRSIDREIWKATRIDGVPAWRVYLHVVLPMLRPYVLTVVMLLSFGVIRSFDLVVAMTGGGPGFATDMPALFMYDHTFTRSRLGSGAASAVMMMGTMIIVLAPYLYLELRKRA